MGLARRQRRRYQNHLHPQSGQSHFAGPLSHLRQRRLGARLLPEIQQPPSGISGRMVERNQLGRSQPALRSLQDWQVSPGASHGPSLGEILTVDGIVWAGQVESAASAVPRSEASGIGNEAKSNERPRTPAGPSSILSLLHPYLIAALSAYSLRSD